MVSDRTLKPMYLLITTLAVILLNIWHRLWLKALDAEALHKHREEMDAEAQRWQM